MSWPKKRWTTETLLNGGNFVRSSSLITRLNIFLKATCRHYEQVWLASSDGFQDRSVLYRYIYSSYSEIGDANLKGTLWTFKHWAALKPGVHYGISILLLLTCPYKAHSGYVYRLVRIRISSCIVYRYGNAWNRQRILWCKVTLSRSLGR